ncbi:hypothetical protein D3C73_1313920 [compost metagenome]
MQHLVTGLLVIGSQGPQQSRILCGLSLNAACLAGSQPVVDQKQLDPATLRQANDLRRNVLLVDQHEVFRALRPREHSPSLAESALGTTRAILHLQRHAQVVSGRLHEARVTDPERLAGQARVEEHDRSGLSAGCQRQAQAQAVAQCLEHAVTSLPTNPRV